MIDFREDMGISLKTKNSREQVNDHWLAGRAGADDL